MGEVYRARDPRLARDVALKVLPEAFAADTERMARFEREAKVLASLNHPNVAAIYGFEESNSVRALVLELVEGATLAERIAQGPIPIEEALPICQANLRWPRIRARASNHSSRFETGERESHAGRLGEAA